MSVDENDHTTHYVDADEPTPSETADTSPVDVYGPRSGSAPALTGVELTSLLKGDPVLAKSLKISI